MPSNHAPNEARARPSALDESNRMFSVVHCGESGMGSVAKICNNMIAGISAIAVAESYAIGQGLGLDPKILYDVVSTSSGQTNVGLRNPPVKGLTETAAAEGRLVRRTRAEVARAKGTGENCRVRR